MASDRLPGHRRRFQLAERDACVPSGLFRVEYAEDSGRGRRVSGERLAVCLNSRRCIANALSVPRARQCGTDRDRRPTRRQFLLLAPPISLRPERQNTFLAAVRTNRFGSEVAHDRSIQIRSACCRLPGWLRNRANPIPRSPAGRFENRIACRALAVYAEKRPVELVEYPYQEVYSFLLCVHHVQRAAHKKSPRSKEWDQGRWLVGLGKVALVYARRRRHASPAIARITSTEFAGSGTAAVAALGPVSYPPS